MNHFVPVFAAVIEERPEIVDLPELDGPGTSGSDYRVILYNDDHTPMDIVTMALMKACEIGKIKAARIMLEAHKKGRAVCFRGSREQCHKCAQILRESRLQCEVDCD